MARALEHQDAIQDESKQGEFGDTQPLVRAKTVPGESPRPEHEAVRSISRQFTGTTLLEPARNISPELTPSISEEDGSEPGVIPPGDARTHRKSTSSIGSRTTRANVVRDWKAHPPSPVRSINDTRDGSRPHSSPKYTALGIEEESGVTEAVEAAIKELYKIRQKEQVARPLRIRPRDSLHTPSESLRNYFHILAKDEMEYRRLNTKDWLRMGTWWLLKVWDFLLLNLTWPIGLLLRESRTRAAIPVTGHTQSHDHQCFSYLLTS